MKRNKTNTPSMTNTTNASASASNTNDNDNDDDELVWYRWVNLLSFVVNVGITYGVGLAGWFGLSTNTVVSAKYPTLITPEGYAFSIWGVIFLLQGIWTLQQFVGLLLRRSSSMLSYTNKIAAVGINYAFVVLAQAMWTFAFGNEWILPSMIIMLILLWNLYVIVFRQLEAVDSGPWYHELLTKVPFTIHFGWILIASVVNINVAMTELDNRNIRFYGGAIGGLIGLVLTTLWIIGGAGYYGVIPCVAVWGLVAVYLANHQDSTVSTDYTQDQINVVKYGALGSAILIALAALVQGIRKTMLHRRHLRINEDTNRGADFARVRDGPL